MGVPRLFKWLCERYPEAVKHFNNNERFDNKGFDNGNRFDNLFIDANAIIHECAQHVYNYGANKRLLAPYINLSTQEKNTKLFDMFFEKILKLNNIIKPTKILYIAIDGCAPAGKMMQQRQRRFVAVCNTSSGSAFEEGTNSVFDSNCISPGTKFMDDLKKFINYKILEILAKQVNPDMKNLRIIFSPVDVPGEGEHKIMEYIRLHINAMKTQKHCMYGPDGDLIMLTLASKCDNFFLLRDDQYNVGKLFLIDIGIFKNQLINDMAPHLHSFHLHSFHRRASQSEVQSKRSLRDSNEKDGIINDFIFMGFFVGNDFLPKIQMFYYLEDGMDFMLGIYLEIRNTPSQGGSGPEGTLKKSDVFLKDNHIISESGDINLDVFSKFIDAIYQKEKYYLTNQIGRNSNNPQFENKTLMKCVTTREDNGNK